MRAKHFISEIDRVGSIKPGNIIHISPWVKDAITQNSKKLPGNNPYYYAVVKDGNDNHIYITDPDHSEVIGKMILESYPFPLPGASTFDYVTVHRDYTGYGISKAMYGIWLSILKRPLLAGGVQTTGGRRNWVSLNRIPGVTVKGYIKINDDDFESDYTDLKNLKQIQDAIMKTGGQYLGADRRGDHYFSFDIESNKDYTELQAVYKRAVDLYHNDYQSIVTGLYAQWSGQ